MLCYNCINRGDGLKTILIIEDDKDINNMLCKLLTYNNYNIVSAFSGTEGVLQHSDNIDLILLDLMLPGKNGEEIISELQAKHNVPIIVMSAIDEINKKLTLFNLGADDYVTKPFNNDELLARIKVQLRNKNINDNKILTFKDIKLDIKNYLVICNNQSLNFSKIEFDLLRVLIENCDQVLTKSILFDRVWPDENSADDNTLNVHISKIRNKLKEVSDTEYIETVWSIGYKMKQDN